MAASAESYHDLFLKDKLLPQVQTFVDQSSKLYMMLEKSYKDIFADLDEGKGDYIETPIELSAEEGVSSVAIEEAYQTAEPATFIRAKARLKYHYGNIRLSGQNKILSAGGGPKSEFAIASILTRKVKSITGTMIQNKNRMLWGTPTGTISHTNGTGTGATALIVDDSTMFRVGMHLYIDAATAELDETITAIDSVTHTLTLDAVATWEDGVIVGRAKSHDNEMEGLRSMLLPTALTDWNVWGTYENIDRDAAATKAWRPFFKENGGVVRDIDLDLMDEFVIDLIDEKHIDPERQTDLAFLMNRDLYRGLIKARKDKNQPTEYRDTKYGWKAPVYDCPFGEFPFYMMGKPSMQTDFKNVILALNLPDVTIRRPYNMQWQAGYSGAILRVVEGYDIETATLIDYEEMFSVAPFRSGVLADVRYPQA